MLSVSHWGAGERERRPCATQPPPFVTAVYYVTYKHSTGRVDSFHRGAHSKECIIRYLSLFKTILYRLVLATAYL